MKDLLIEKADFFTHDVYKVTRYFPKEELYGLISQLRRSSLSIVLNLIEGYARTRNTEYIHFLEISYGSLKESKYLLHFSMTENYLKETDYRRLINQAEEIGKMIWERMTRLKSKQRK